MSNIHPTAIIDSQAEIHPSTIILAFAVIKGRVKINKNCVVGNHTTIGADPITGDISTKQLEYSIIIDEGCFIGDGVVIQSGCITATKIKKNSTINHNCSIGHGVVIGKKCFIGLNNSISGKSKLGNNVVSGPGCTFNNLSEVGNNVRIGIGSLILHKIDDNLVVIGRPARNIVLEKNFNQELRKLLNDDRLSNPITSPLGKYKFLRKFLKPIFLILPNFFKKRILNYLESKSEKKNKKL